MLPPPSGRNPCRLRLTAGLISPNAAGDGASGSIASWPCHTRYPALLDARFLSVCLVGFDHTLTISGLDQSNDGIHNGRSRARMWTSWWKQGPVDTEFDPKQHHLQTSVSYRFMPPGFAPELAIQPPGPLSASARPPRDVLRSVEFGTSANELSSIHSIHSGYRKFFILRCSLAYHVSL